MNNPHEVLLEIESRAAAIGHNPNDTVYRLCVEDVLGVLAAKMAKSGVPVSSLTDEELGNVLERADQYLKGEGMPWHDVVSLGIADAWPERLNDDIREGKQDGDNWYFDADGPMGLGTETFGPYNSPDEAREGMDRLREKDYKNFSEPFNEGIDE